MSGPDPAGRVCAVTGAAGYLGSRFVAGLRADGWKVYRLTREPGTDGESIHFDLGASIAAEEFSRRGIRVLIHCAYDLSLLSWEDIRRVNVLGSSDLIRAAVAGGVRHVVFISSVAAYEGCVTLYGRAKLEIESEVRKAGGSIVRPGLVHGAAPGGMLGKIRGQVLASRVLPVIVHRAPLYLVHEEDLTRTVVGLASGRIPRPSHPLVAAAPRGWTLTQILRSLAEREGRRVFLIPVPWWPVWTALKALECAGIGAAYRSDSVLSLAKFDPGPLFDGRPADAPTFREFDSP
jgi:nucleoside-diphosphate-sugar epimerase